MKPEDVIVTVIIKKTFTANPATDKGFVTLENVPCGALAKINISLPERGELLADITKLHEKHPLRKSNCKLGQTRIWYMVAIIK